MTFTRPPPPYVGRALHIPLSRPPPALPAGGFFIFRSTKRHATVKPRNQYPQEDAVREVPSVGTDLAHRSHVARPAHHQGAAVVLGRPARRQPGADRPDGPDSQAAHVRGAGQHGVQGDRGRVPAASQPDFDFIRQLINEDLDSRRRHDPGARAMPAGADRAHLRVHPGAPRAIIHFYNSTNPLQRQVVFGSTRTASSTSPSTPPASPQARGQHPSPPFATSTRRRASRSPSPTSLSRSASG